MGRERNRRERQNPRAMAAHAEPDQGSAHQRCPGGRDAAARRSGHPTAVQSRDADRGDGVQWLDGVQSDPDGDERDRTQHRDGGIRLPVLWPGRDDGGGVDSSRDPERAGADQDSEIVRRGPLRTLECPSGDDPRRRDEVREDRDPARRGSVPSDPEVPAQRNLPDLPRAAPHDR